MPLIATDNSPISGMTTGEHHTPPHKPPHSPVPITGHCVCETVPWVTIDGKGVIVVGDPTVENDACCGQDSGKVSNTNASSVLRINGKAVALVGTKIDPHNGTAEISGSTQSTVTSV